MRHYIEKETNNYYKIEFDDCSVCGSRVFVKFRSYTNESERQKEKDRSAAIAKFFRDLRQKLYERQLAAEEGEQGTKSLDALSKMENQTEAKPFAVFGKAQDGMDAMELYEKAIPEQLMRSADDGLETLKIEGVALRELEALGFDKTWITDPVMITGSATVYAGDYAGEPITREFYYNRLKTVMGETEDC